MRILLTGASGLLGRYLLASRPPNVTVVGWCGPTEASGGLLTPIDLANLPGVEAAFRLLRPQVVVHLAAWSGVLECARDPARARRINTDATAHLAALARAEGSRFLFASTDLVFDGSAAPYTESAPTRPLSVYGRTKAEAEVSVLASGGTVVRFPLLFGPGRDGPMCFFDALVTGLRTGQEVTLFHDEHRTPLDLRTAAIVLWALCERPVSGIVHAGGAERLSRLELGQRLARHLGLSAACLRAVSRQDVPGLEQRPADTSLDSSRLMKLLPALVRPTFEQTLAGFYASGSVGGYSGV